MKYSPEFDRDNSVKKVHLGEEILYLVPEGENYTFCSNNPKLQKWCETVEDVGFIKDKKVPQEQFSFVIGAAKDYLHGRPLGTYQRARIRILSEWPKGEDISDSSWEGCVFVGNGTLPASEFKGLKNSDEIYKKAISQGAINNEFIDSLPAMKDQPKKSSTRMVVDYPNEVAKFCARCGFAGLSEIQVAEDAGLDAIGAAWLIREKMATGKLPEIADQLAEIADKVTYGQNNMPIKEYAKTLPACINAIISEIRGSKNFELEEGMDKANQEVLKIFDALNAEKVKNPDFDLETADIRDFIEKSPLVSKYAKEKMMEGIEKLKVTLIPTDENSGYYQEHVANRHGKNSTTIGSKLLADVPDGYMLNLLKETDQEYQKLIDEEWRPGRKVFAVEADRPIGTNAVFPIENLDKSAVFSTIREPGTERAAKIRVALISEEDMPKTNIAQVVMGHYGPTGKAGNYTVIFGDEGMPFPEGVAKRNPDDKEFIDKCQKYWDSHVMLITPKELEANISELKALGMDTKTQELALKTFLQRQQHQRTSPIIKPFTPEISPGAIRLNMSKTKDTNSKTYS